MKIPRSQQPLFDKTNDFMFAMARMEFALKAAGYIKSDGEADWGRFAQVVAPYFENPSERLATAVTYILANPPHKLKYKDGQLTWEEARPPIAMSTGELVLLYLRRVRGNCFQGGDGVEPPENHKPLLKYGTWVIRELLKVALDVKVAFKS